MTGKSLVQDKIFYLGAEESRRVLFRGSKTIPRAKFLALAT